MYATWQSRPVFITSTFRDMQAERDYLRARVFPVIEERLRRRYHFLEPIDLRWGVQTISVSEQQTKELLVLKVCLAEIKRSRPFLIALIGDRYGWVPPEERMRTATAEAGYQTEARGKSVTALEIEYGILDSPDQRKLSRFYFRDPLPYDAMGADAAVYSDLHSGEPGAADAHDRLETLKGRIEREMPGRVRHYHAEWDAEARCVTGLDAWGAQVLEDLWADLDEATKAYEHAEPATWQHEEAAVLEQFVQTQCREFIGRTRTVDDLLALATSPAAPDAEWGACVSGEAGSGKSSLFGELVKRLQDPDDVLVLAHAAGIGARAGQIDILLRRWTQQLAESLGVPDPAEGAKSREDLEKAFAALLSRASAQRRVVCLLDALNQFERTTAGRFVTWLPALWPANARLIATAIPGEESEALGKRKGVRVVALPVLDEREAGAIAEAVCRRYHRELHAEILSILLSKRDGGRAAAGNPLWLELALEELNLLDADDFARLDREFTGSADQRLHELMCLVASALPSDVEGLYGYLLERTEELHGENWARGFARLIALSRTGWRESDLRELLPLVCGVAWDPLRFAALRRSFRAHLVQRGGAGQWDFSHAQIRVAVERRALGGPDLVLQLHSLIADHLEGLPQDDPLGESELMVHLIAGDDGPRAARVYADLPDKSGALRGATEALARHIALGAVERPNRNVPWIAALLTQPGLTDPQLANLALRFLFDLHDAIENTADLPGRQALIISARRDLERLAEADPSNAGWQRGLSVCQGKLGNVLQARGDLAGARQAYGESLVICQRLVAADPSNLGWQRDLYVSHRSLGDVLQAQGHLAGSLQAYGESLAVMRHLAAADPSNPQWHFAPSETQLRLGVVLEARGNLAGARQAYGESLAVSQLLAAADPSNAEWQQYLSARLRNVGDVQSAQGNLSGALESYRASLAIRERLAAQDPGNPEWQRDLSRGLINLGDMLQAQGDLAGARQAYGESLAVMQLLAAADPSNAGWQRDLCVSCVKMAYLCSQAGDAVRPDWLQRPYDVLREMKQRGMFLSAKEEKALALLRSAVEDGVRGLSPRATLAIRGVLILLILPFSLITAVRSWQGDPLGPLTTTMRWTARGLSALLVFGNLNLLVLVANRIRRQRH